MTTHEKAQEIDFGVSQEDDILREWIARSKYASGAAKAVTFSDTADFDRILFSKDGLPLCYVELKARRSTWGRYPDVLFPRRKHQFAKRLEGYSLAFIGVTRYACGTIVEVHLGDTPDSYIQVERRDRPGRSYPHVTYVGEKLTVYPPENSGR